MSMGPPGRASELRGSAVLRVILGSQLRQFREDAGVTSEQRDIRSGRRARRSAGWNTAGWPSRTGI